MNPIQYSLYKTPLYKHLKSGQQDLKIIIDGFDEQKQKLADLLLQTAQIPGLNITLEIFPNTLAQKKQYLFKRKALNKFFEIDGNLPMNLEDLYGKIHFHDIEKNEEFRNLISSEKIHEIFISNPEKIELILGMSKNIPQIRLLWDQPQAPNCSLDHVELIELSKDPSEDELSQELDRMAFNGHLVWQNDLDISYKEEEQIFKDPYYYNTSLSNALNLKYKLHAVGLDLDELGTEEAAKKFHEMELDDFFNNSEIKNKLIAYEHRRWVTEKITEGWIELTDFTHLSQGNNKFTYPNTKKIKEGIYGEHICIVPSQANQLLTFDDHYWFNDYDQLDPLDQKAVDEHNFYVEQASKLPPLSSRNELHQLETMLMEDRKALSVFHQWRNALEEMEQGISDKVNLYNTLLKRLKNEVKAHPAQKEILTLIDSLDRWFLPIRKSLLFTDYKALDNSLVSSIPFILTYRTDFHLVIPYQDESNDAVFANVAASLMIHPGKITFVSLVRNDYEAYRLKSSLNALKNLLQKKKLDSEINLILLDQINQEQQREIEQAFPSIQCTWIDFFDPTSAIKQLKEILNGLEPFYLENNQSAVSLFMQGAGFYQQFPWYVFDQNSLSFTHTKGANVLEYVQKKPYLSIEDMLALTMSFNQKIEQPDYFSSYKRIWERYKENTADWKYFSDQLAEIIRNNDKIFFNNPQKNSYSSRQYNFTFDSYHLNFVRQLIEDLISRDILDKKSGIIKKGNKWQAVLVDKADNFKSFEILFVKRLNKIDRSFDYDSWIDKKGHFNVLAHRMEIAWKDCSKLHQEMLYFFEEEDLIYNLFFSGNTAYFTFSSLEAKDLMSMAGKALEIYTYHKIRDANAFDDIASSYVIDWSGSGIQNEFDCILTKGFQSLFIECKARKQIDQNFYYKLASLVHQLGINAKLVLIADTEENIQDKAKTVQNAIQRERGNRLNVTTIWKQEDIDQLDQKLLEILNDKNPQ